MEVYRERVEVDTGYMGRLEKIWQAVVGLVAAHEATNSPYVFAEKLLERADLLPNGDEQDLRYARGIVWTVLDEDIRRAELFYDWALDNLVYGPPEPKLDILE